MSKLLIGFILIICFCGLAWADTATITDTRSFLDPGGYKDAKWGMTIDEVKQAITGVNWVNNWAFGSQCFQDTILEHSSYLNFFFDNNKKLIKTKIYVVHKVIKSGSFFSLDEYDDTDLFNSISRVLREKYGEPESVYRNTMEMGPSTLNWIFPTTQITLEVSTTYITKVGNVPLGINNIYFQRSIKEGKQEDKDKL